jgi:Tetracyclin repressor-like, C-terminal domain
MGVDFFALVIVRDSGGVLLDTFLEFALCESRRYEAAFLLPARRARKYPDDFSAGRSPVLNMVHARIEEARARGLVNGTPAVDIGLHLSALGHGLISMHRAGRFVNEKEFRATWRRAMDHALGSFFTISLEKAP